MKTNHAMLATLLATAVLTGGCASPYSRSDTSQSDPSSTSRSYANTYGVVDSIEVIHGKETGVAGTIIGGVIGGVLGNQVGKGDGNTAATIVGAAGGAVAGHEIEKNYQTEDSYQIGVGLDNGSYQTLIQDNITGIQVGSRVSIVDGRVYRY